MGEKGLSNHAKGLVQRDAWQQLKQQSAGWDTTDGKTAYNPDTKQNAAFDFDK